MAHQFLYWLLQAAMHTLFQRINIPSPLEKDPRINDQWRCQGVESSQYYFDSGTWVQKGFLGSVGCAAGRVMMLP
jgi:hypothetical protein